MGDQSQGSDRTAAEVLRELEADPARVAALKERDQARRLRVQANLAELAPLLARLRAQGVDVDALVLAKTHPAYEAALPTLLEWLPRVSRPDNKKAIADALASPKARPVAAPALLDEFRQTVDVGLNSVRWVVADALSVVIDDSVFDRVSATVRDARFGFDRAGLLLGLIRGRRNRRVTPLLESLLDDPEVAGVAAYVLVRAGRHDRVGDSRGSS
jgi:hypothetical protein